MIEGSRRGEYSLRLRADSIGCGVFFNKKSMEPHMEHKVSQSNMQNYLLDKNFDIRNNGTCAASWIGKCQFNIL